MMSSVTDARALAPIEQVRLGAFRIPTDLPESDGTLEWDATTLVVVELTANGETGLGYTYGDAVIAGLIDEHFASLLRGRSTAEIPALGREMIARLRNLGGQGITAMAVSAVDTALWDLHARQLGLALGALLGAARPTLPVYGSGGFTSYSDAQLTRQFEAWASRGIVRFKMKVGREPGRDHARAHCARSAIGARAALFVDANSAYDRRQALAAGKMFAAEFGVTWFEQPLAPEDLVGLKFLRERVPAPLEITDGEYGYELDYFRRLIAADAVDVVMADVTRCGGITGFLKVAALCEAAALPMSSHCAPALHVHPGCAVAPLRHAELFHDHERIERELFDGAIEVRDGALRPDLARPGHGLAFKWSDAARYAT